MWNFDIVFKFKINYKIKLKIIITPIRFAVMDKGGDKNQNF